MSTTQTTAQATSTLPAPATYVVDPAHSSVGFVARHLVASKVRGSFGEFEGEIVIGATPEASSVRATVKAASITTNQAQRDEHLRSTDFLEATTYPELTLVSTRVVPRGGEHFDLVTDVTIKGVTREVVFDLEYLGQSPGMRPGTSVVGFEASATIDRRDFGVSFNGTLENGSLVVSNRIELELAIEATTTAE